MIFHHGNVVIDTKELYKDCVEYKRIGIIKKYRELTGLGLKDSKDTIDKFCDLDAKTIDSQGVIDCFKDYCGVLEPLSKEHFMQIIEEAIDNMDKFYYTDMLEAVESLCKNIRKQGGLDPIAKKYNDILNAI